MWLWRGLFLTVALVVALPGAALAADPVFETYKVPTVGGAEINVEVTFGAGHRVGLIVQASNTVWAVPDDPGAKLSVEYGWSALELPLP